MANCYPLTKEEVNDLLRARDKWTTEEVNKVTEFIAGNGWVLVTR